MAIELTRNFCIIAHIDHGKTTLSVGCWTRPGAIQDRERQDQLLDSMDLERERDHNQGASGRDALSSRPGRSNYRLNLLDTPGT